MPTNAVSPTSMNNTLAQQFGDIRAFRPNSASACGVFHAPTASGTSFNRAALASCSNSDLIKGILKSCPGIASKNLEAMLSKTSISCAGAIKKLYTRRDDIHELMRLAGFSPSDTDSSNKEALLHLIACGFSFRNLLPIFDRPHQEQRSLIRILVKNHGNLNGLVQKGISANAICSILAGSGANLNESIEVLVNHQEHLQRFTKDGFSKPNIASMLSGSGSNLKDSIQALINNQEKLRSLNKKGISPRYISGLLLGRGGELGQAIQHLTEHSSFVLDLIKSGTLSLIGIRDELRNQVSTTAKAVQGGAQVEQAAEVVVADDFAGSSVDEFVADLAGLLLLAPNCSGDQFLPATEALVKHRNALLQLHTRCGFSANHIAGILNYSEANLGKAIGELSGKAILLFGLIQEGYFTAGELAEKLHGSGAKVGEVFGKDPAIRAALHASYSDNIRKSAAPAAKRPRFA